MSDAAPRLRRRERILEVSRDRTTTVALEPLLQKIVSVAAELTGSEAASILLLSADTTNYLRFCATTEVAQDRLRDIPVPVDASIAGEVFLSGKPAVISDVDTAPRHYRLVGHEMGFTPQSLLAVALQIKQRRIGVLEAVNKTGGGTFSEEDVEMLAALAAQAAAAIENARLVGALRDANERLGQLDRLKSDFIAVASHELRTPLALILGYASYLQDDVDPSAAEKVKVVVQAATRLQQIIETMLNLRYLETGQLALEVTGFDLRAEVQAVCDELRAMAAVNEVALEIDVPGDEVIIWADRAKVRVVLDNLIANAVKFNFAGGRVRVAIRRLGNEVAVRVTDTGIGIPSRELTRIFDRFGQLEDPLSRQHGGMGLGLSTVKGLVECHGGRVWAESIVAQGSSFCVVLPTGSSPAGASDGPLHRAG